MHVSCAFKNGHFDKLTLFRMPKRSFDWDQNDVCLSRTSVYQPQLKNKISERVLLQNSSCDKAKEKQKIIEAKTLNLLFSAQKKKCKYDV